MKIRNCCVFFHKLRWHLKYKQGVALTYMLHSFWPGKWRSLCFTFIRINRHVQFSALCGCWFVNWCVTQCTSCQPSNLWYQLPVSITIELWALRSAWTLTKSFYSSELNALHYYLISRSTQAGITVHPELIDDLYKAFSVNISQS